MTPFKTKNNTETVRMLISLRTWRTNIFFECIGHTQTNDSDTELDAGIVGTRLLETNGSIRKHVTKKRKKVDVAEAIEVLGDK